MKKIAVLFALAALATAGGCLSNGAQACIKAQECAEEADPAAKCQELQDECDADADCKAGQEKCATESDALAACLVASGTCDTIEGVDGKFFGVEATAEDGACNAQATAAGECAAE
jgi:hypothetical protein